MDRNRRHVLLHSTGALAGLGLAQFGIAAPAENTAVPTAGVHVELRAVRDRVNLRRGNTTAVWRYEGELLQGEAESLQAGDGYLGPTICVRRGQRLRVERSSPTTCPDRPRFAGTVFTCRTTWTVVALVLQDRNFDRDNQFVYPSGGMGGGGKMGPGMMGSRRHRLAHGRRDGAHDGSAR